MTAVETEPPKLARRDQMMRGRLTTRDFSMSDCPIHGFAPSYIFSPDLLELQEDGSLPDVLTIEVEGGFFRFNISSRKAREYGIEGTHVPFDGTACDIMDGLQEMCGHCFEERRKTLEAQQKRDG